jgi:hypothetical protein
MLKVSAEWPRRTGRGIGGTWAADKMAKSAG